MELDDSQVCIFADIPHSWPPTVIVAGSRDVLLSDAICMLRKLRTAGIDTDLHVWDGMPHAGFVRTRRSRTQRRIKTISGQAD